MVQIGDLSENMRVRARQGEELGTIIRLEEDGILVEKGIFFLKDYLVPIALVSEVRDGDAYLSVTRDELQREREAGGTGSKIADRTLREESAKFVHEGEEVGAGGTRTPDNLKEGDTAAPASER